MQPIDTLLAQFLSGRSLYAPLRRVLNFVFVASLASYAFIHFHGPYRIFQWSERDAIINFFVHGDFTIPFALFVIVYYITQWIPVFLFGGLVYLIRIKMVRVITRKRISKRKVQKWVNYFLKLSEYTPEPLTKEQAIGVFQQYLAHLTPSEVTKLEKEMEEPLKLAEANIILFFRTALAITVYFNTLPHFGWRLYTLVITVLLVALFLLIIATLLLQVLPPLLHRLRQEVERYLQSQASSSVVRH